MFHDSRGICHITHVVLLWRSDGTSNDLVKRVIRSPVPKSLCAIPNMDRHPCRREERIVYGTRRFGASPARHCSGMPNVARAMPTCSLRSVPKGGICSKSKNTLSDNGTDLFHPGVNPAKRQRNSCYERCYVFRAQSSIYLLPTVRLG